MFNIFCLKRVAACAVPLCLLLSVQSVHGADIAYEIRQGSEKSVSFELGFAAALIYIPIVGWVTKDAEDPTGAVLELGLLFNGRAEWKGLFVETNSDSFSILAAGYTPWRNETTRVDLVFTDGLGRYEPRIGEFESVNNRSSDLMAGIRVTHTAGNTLAQLEGYSDVSGKHDGHMVAVQVGKFRQVRNWNLHGLVGARYFTGNMLDYYFGISEEESTASIPLYEASGGTLATLELGATLPVGDGWIFKATTEGLYLPDSVTESPLADGNLGVIVSTSLSYVF